MSKVSVQLKLTVSTAVYEFLSKNAARFGVSVSAYIRHLLMIEMKNFETKKPVEVKQSQMHELFLKLDSEQLE